MAKFKIGDKVIVRKRRLELDEESHWQKDPATGIVWNDYGNTGNMDEWIDKVVTIERIAERRYSHGYEVEECRWTFAENWLDKFDTQDDRSMIEAVIRSDQDYIPQPVKYADPDDVV